MRILHVDTALSWRGGQNQVLLAARGMAARGHAVAVACRGGGALETRVREAGIDTFPIGVRRDLAPLGVLGLARAMGAFRPDVAQLHDPHAVGAGLMASRLREARASSPRGASTSRCAGRSRGGSTRAAGASSR
jgi:hypothetical protein